MTNLRKLANGQFCRVRLPGICGHGTQTTVLAHLKNGWYGSSKPPDIIGVFACRPCHDVIDGRNMHSGLTREEIDLAAYRALCEQLAWYAKEGIIRW